MSVFSLPRTLLALAACLLLGATSALAQSLSALPAAQVGQNYSFQVTTTPAAASGTTYAATGLPAGLSINASSGQITGAPTTAGTSSGTISLTESGVTNSFSYSLVVNPVTGTPVVSSATTATGTVGTAFSYTVAASNTPTSFNVGALPAGLSANTTTGAVTGTPTAAGTYSVSLSANNSSGTGAATTLTITINPAGAVPAITSATTATGTPNVAFTYTITASNTPVSFAATGLPLGLSVNTTTGVISGTPTVAGVSTIGLSATNNNGTGASTNLTLTVGALSSITSVATANGGVGVSFSYTVTASNTPTSFNISGLPAGLTANTGTGVISGTPTATGTTSISLSANNLVGTGPVTTLSLTVGSVPVISSATSAAGTAGSPFSYTIVASNTPTSYSATGLPSGLTLNTATGVISGTPGQSGTFSVSLTATNVSGPSTSVVLTISLAARPSTDQPVSVIVQPQSQSVNEGTSVSFSVFAGGSSPTYQWNKDGVAIAGATSSSLNLIGVKAADAGNYTVTVANTLGSVASAAAKLTVAALVVPPVITASPASQAVVVGANVTFTVTATSSAPLTYQWQKNGFAILGETNPTLTLNAVTLTAVGSYGVVVTNSAGSTTSGAGVLSITAGPVPVITSAASATGLPGVPFSYTITATNSPVSFAASGLPAGLSLNSALGVISGTPSSAGVSVVALTATNLNGTSVVSNLTVTIGALPAITSAAAATAIVGVPFTYTITASNTPTSFSASGLPPGLSVNTVTGVISGNPTASGLASVSLSATNANGTGPVATLALATGSVPVITSATTASGASGSPFSYSISASNSPTSFSASGLPGGLSLNTSTGVISGTPTAAGTSTVSIGATNTTGSSANVSLVITITSTVVPIAITTQPASKSATEGSSVSFSVSVTGTSPTYQWSKGGAAIAGATGSTFALSAVTASNAGSYSVTVTNSLGSVISSSASLTVTALVVPPVVTVGPIGGSVTAGTTVTFNVVASGSAPLSYQWRKDGVAIAGATNSTLTLNTVAPSAAGSYSVVVTNSAGSITSAAGVLGVTARPVTGSYFGAFGNNGGTFALFVRSDRTGVFLGYARGAKVAFVSRDVIVDVNGRFTVTTTAEAPASTAAVRGAVAAEVTYVIDGAIGADGAISGTVSGLNLTLSAPAAATTGATAAVAGFYQAGAAGTSATTYTIVGVAGDAYVFTVSGNNVDAGKGTVDATGKVTVTTENNATVTGAIQAGTISVVATPSGGTAVTFVGANNDVRTETERLHNLSTRSQTGTGSNVLIAGFVIKGTQPKPVLVRAIGPTLAQFGLTGALSAARLEIFKDAASIAVGTDWGTGAGAAAIAAAAARVGAFPLASSSRDAALLLTLEPGTYTAIVTGQNGVTGVSLVEAYDATSGPIPATDRLINISSRAAVGSGDSTLIGGFYISGAVPKRVLVRGVGPGLAQFGLTGTLARAQLLLFKGSQTLAQNAGWSTSSDAAAIATAAAQVGAFAFTSGSADAALLVSLEPGAYTAQVVGVGGATGIALVEIYEVP